MIYPGKLTVADSFRIGCIGRLNAEHMRGALAAVGRGARRSWASSRRLASANGEASL